MMNSVEQQNKIVCKFCLQYFYKCWQVNVLKVNVLTSKCVDKYIQL